MANEKMKQTRQELELSQAELAKRVGMKPNTAAVKLYRAREALRVYLAERGYSV